MKKWFNRAPNKVLKKQWNEYYNSSLLNEEVLDPFKLRSLLNVLVLMIAAFDQSSQQNESIDELYDEIEIVVNSLLKTLLLIFDKFYKYRSEKMSADNTISIQPDLLENISFKIVLVLQLLFSKKTKSFEKVIVLKGVISNIIILLEFSIPIYIHVFLKLLQVLIKSSPLCLIEFGRIGAYSRLITLSVNHEFILHQNEIVNVIKDILFRFPSSIINSPENNKVDSLNTLNSNHQCNHRHY
jgi:hypothetical protein